MGGFFFPMSVREALKEYDDLKKRAVSEYKKGASLAEIARELHLSRQTIFSWLRGAAVKIRDKKKAAALRVIKRKYRKG